MRTKSNQTNNQAVVINKEETTMQEQQNRAKELLKMAKAMMPKNHEVYKLVNKLYEDTKAILNMPEGTNLLRYTAFDYVTSHIIGIINAAYYNENEEQQQEILDLLGIGDTELALFQKARPYYYTTKRGVVRSSEGNPELLYILMYNIATELGINLDSYSLLISEGRMEQMYNFIRTKKMPPLESDTLITADVLLEAKTLLK